MVAYSVLCAGCVCVFAGILLTILFTVRGLRNGGGGGRGAAIYPHYLHTFSDMTRAKIKPENILRIRRSGHNGRHNDRLAERAAKYGLFWDADESHDNKPIQKMRVLRGGLL